MFFHGCPPPKPSCRLCGKTTPSNYITKTPKGITCQECQEVELFTINREIEDIYIVPEEGLGLREEYRGWKVEVCFKCYCDDYADDHGGCGDKFYLTQNGKTFTNSFAYTDKEEALKRAKVVINKIVTGNLDIADFLF